MAQFSMVAKVVSVLGQIAAVTGSRANLISWKTLLRLFLAVGVIVVTLQATHAPLHLPAPESLLQSVERSAEAPIQKSMIDAGQHDNIDHVHETPMIVSARWVNPADWLPSWNRSHTRTEVPERAALIYQPPRPEQRA
ncbi:hypothetical protein [Pelagibacterium sp.]|uniref:hypothetical protein n=1 Tax=Pelagibacterium sp. TaxID=1967288 RepID=UPI003BAD12EF